MTVVRTAYRYKRPAGKRKPVALEVPAVVPTKSSHRPIREKEAAAEVLFAPDRKPAIVTTTSKGSG
jgi:hypothetical protein